MSVESENHSYFFQSTPITTNITIPDWGRRYYQVNATAGPITITIQAPTDVNEVEPGTIAIERLDFPSTNTVTVNILTKTGTTPWTIPPSFLGLFYTATACSDPTGTANIIFGVQTPYLAVPITGALMQGTIDSSNFVMRSANPTDINSITSTDVVNYRTAVSLVSAARVSKIGVATIAVTDQSVVATNYIGLVISGYTLALGDSLLLSGQTNAVENGIYTVQTGGGILRRQDCFTGVDCNGYIVPVNSGALSNRVYRLSNQTLPFGSAVVGIDLISVSLYIITNSTTPPEDRGIHTATLVNSNYTMLSTDYRVHVNSTTGPITITLPAANSFTSPVVKSYQILKTDISNNVITIQAAGADTLSSGGNSFQFYMPYQQVDLTSDSLSNIFYIS